MEYRTAGATVAKKQQQVSWKYWREEDKKEGGRELIWYFLAGMIAGAVGAVKFIEWASEKFKETGEDDDECSGERPGDVDRPL